MSEIVRIVYFEKKIIAFQINLIPKNIVKNKLLELNKHFYHQNVFLKIRFTN